ncbi:MAG: hypothetical protein LBL00_06465 [Endomicrobium sp.]|jgi:hypothetical protein|nr:hypothetical protein [Endomicrobium sp.]
MKKIILSLIFLSALAASSWAAVGCDLNDPDRDVKRFFPSSNGYKTAYLSIDKLGGAPLLKEVEEKLGDTFQGLYETIDVPYTLYTVFKDKEVIGYIHGINQKGRYGGLQVFLVYDKNQIIKNFYFQKLTSKKAKELRSAEFAKQFEDLSLSDFGDYDPKTGETKNQKVADIKNPDPEDTIDFPATLRAVKKNLVLVNIFLKDN